jgi:acyl-CoA thioesterase-1
MARFMPTLLHASFIALALALALALPVPAGATGPAAAPRAIRVLALGDSLTEGYGVAQTQAYPALLEQALQARTGREVRVINAGIGGSTSASALSRIRWHLRAKPDLVVLALGANDMLRGLSPESCEKNLDQALALLSEHSIPAVLAGMRVPPNYGADYRRRFEAIYPRLAARHRVPIIPFLLEGVAGSRELNQEDGIHPNEKGHQTMARTVLPWVEHWIASQKQPLPENR